MTVQAAPFVIVLLLTGCGTPKSSGAPQADMAARTWKFYETHREEIEPMQKICREWSASNAPTAVEPAVVGANCRAAAFAKSQLQLTK